MYTPDDLAAGAPIVTKRILLASTLLIPASGLGQAVGRWGGVQFAKAVQRIVMDPVGTMRGVSGALNTYKRLAGIAAAYNYFNKPKNYKSSGSSSRAYQQNGSPGGTSSKKGPASYDIPQEGYRKRSGTRGPCESGYVLKKVKGRWMCVRRRTRKR